MFIDEDCIIGFNTRVAEIYGLQTATIYNRIGWLNSHNEDATAESILDGFPFLNINQVKHSLRALEKGGAICSSQPNKTKMDATKHYFALSIHESE